MLEEAGVDSGLDDEIRRKHERGWLEVLYAYFHRELAHGHFFRTAVDNWFMYHRGQRFLTRNGGPRFFNTPKSNDKRLEQFDFRSVGARALIDNPIVSEKKLIVDHAVPVSVLHKIIRDKAPTSPEEIEAVLVRLYRLGVITYEEDQRLKKADLEHKMPTGWSVETGKPFARYEEAGIVAEPRSPGLA